MLHLNCALKGALRQNALFADYVPLSARTLLIPFTELYTVFIASPAGKKEAAHNSLSLPVSCCLFSGKWCMWKKLRGYHLVVSPSCLFDHWILMEGAGVDLVSVIKLAWFEKVMQGWQLWKAFSSMSEFKSWCDHTGEHCIKLVVCCDQLRSVKPANG